MVKMSEVVKLTPKPTASEQNKRDATELLREALTRAEAGTVLGAIIITKDTDDMWTHKTTATMEVCEEIGAIEIIKSEIIRASTG